MKKSGDFVKVEYVDAHFSYKEEVNPPVGFVVSCGHIISETPDYIDLEIAWKESPHQTLFGVVISKRILSNCLRKGKMFKDSYAQGDTIAVYWDDIFTYDEEYEGAHSLTPMLTEGILLKETDTYLLIDNPETLNIREAVNHPEKKPQRYYIPKGMVREVKIVKSNG